MARESGVCGIGGIGSRGRAELNRDEGNNEGNLYRLLASLSRSS
jgi:hypothetical protein